MARVCVSIVNYNTAPQLCRCLDSLFREQLEEVRIQVVDNNSLDGSVELIQERYPELHCLANDVNLGFGAAHNQVLRTAEEEYLFLLNPDTELRPGCLAALLDFMEQHPQVGLAGPQILNPDGSRHNSLEREYPGQHYSRGELAGLPGSIAWVLGAAMIARRAALEDVGGFDERFFLYGEDIDLCLELRKQGWEIGFVAGAGVMHLEGESEKDAPGSEVMARKIRAELIFLQKHYRPVTLGKIRRARLLQAWWRLATLWPAVVFSPGKRRREKLSRYLITAREYGALTWRMKP